MKELLRQMTTEEKLGQLVMISPFFFTHHEQKQLTGPLVELGLTEDELYFVGSILGIGSPEEMIKVQEKYLKRSRLKIPLIFMADIIHGYQTIFPIPLALASSFNEELVETAAKIAAKEAASSGIGVSFSPMADLSRDPRWGRVMESFGEDPYLNYLFSAATTRGYQGKNIKEKGKIASCVKHFAAYGLAEAGKDYNTVDLSVYNLKQNFLSGYKGAIDAGAKMVMNSFNIFQGVPAVMNRYLLQNILRAELGFNGIIISDYNAVKETVAHGVSADFRAAAINSFTAGTDIEMASATYFKVLKELFDQNKLPLKLLDEAVLRVLNLKQELGLFENPYKDASTEDHNKIVMSDKHLAEALKVAHQSLVLLKNENHVLPLQQNAKIALFGPNSAEANLNGAWSWHGYRAVNKTLKESLEETNSLALIEDADYIVYFGGEKNSESGEAKSKTNLDFPEAQLKELVALRKYNKPIILLIAAGRPLILTEVEKLVDSIIYTWFLGTKSAAAIRETIFGLNNPSAKLPMSFPRNCGQIPIYYNHLPTGRPADGIDDSYRSAYLDSPNTPLYPFGYGLSYSQFKLKNITLDSAVIKPEQAINLSVEVCNCSERAGYEVVQIYLRDLVAQVSRPILEFKKFKKVFVNGKSSVNVNFQINQEDLVYYNSHGKLVLDEGEFELHVAQASNKIIKSFTINFLK